MAENVGNIAHRKSHRRKKASLNPNPVDAVTLENTKMYLASYFVARREALVLARILSILLVELEQLWRMLDMPLIRKESKYVLEESLGQRGGLTRCLES